MTTGDHPTTSQDVELQRDEHLVLDAVELLWRSRGVRQVPGQPGHVGSPGSPDRSSSAVATQVPQPIEVGVSQDPELHANGHGSTHTRRYQVALTSQPGGGPVGRPGVWDLRSLP